jgi:hypothetical protein
VKGRDLGGQARMLHVERVWLSGMVYGVKKNLHGIYKRALAGARGCDTYLAAPQAQ